MKSTISVDQQVVLEWVKIFPRHVADDFKSSMDFMKLLTVVAISKVFYLKDVLPSDSYSVETFADIQLHILKNKCRDGLAQFLSTSLMDAFDAVDKKYLHRLALCFYLDENKSANVIESHVFEYSYSADGVSMDIHSKSADGVERTDSYTFGDIRTQTSHLLRALIVLMAEHKVKLPSDFGVTLRLYYFEDTPADYHAPGYVEDCEGASLFSGLEHYKLGAVATRHHGVHLMSYFKPTPVVSNKVEESSRLKCPCGKGDSTDVEEFITCHYCNTKQHAACYGVRRGGAALLARHCCLDCHAQDPRRAPTDPVLPAQPPHRRISMCIYRRVLEHCSQHAAVDAGALSKQFRMSQANARSVMQALRRQGVIPNDQDNDLNKPQKIDKNNLKLNLDKFFNTKEDNIVDRLLAETVASQKSFESNPIDEALSPVEKSDLRNTSNLGRVIEKEDNPIVEDATLTKYKEALVADCCKELPSDPFENKKSAKRKSDNTANAKPQVAKKRAPLRLKRK